MKNKVDKVRRFISQSIVTLGVMTSGLSICYADNKFAEATQKTAEGLQVTALGMLKWLVMIALVVGGLLIGFGTSRQREEVKEKAPYIIIGGILVAGAATFAGIIFAWF